MVIKKLIMASLLLGGVATCNADDFVVKNIQFKGLQRVTPGAALLSMPITVGDTVTAKAVGATIHVVNQRRVNLNPSLICCGILQRSEPSC